MLRIPAGPPCAVWLVVPLLGWAATHVAAQLVINELLPDPSGSDAGREFVELLNTGTAEIDLGGIQLQFANGAEGPVWQTRWTGVNGRLLPAGARFLIVDRNWLGSVPGDAEVLLALQNGPDAVRLVREGQTLDLVGYGQLTDSRMMEQLPAPLVSGRSVSRRPDGRDTGNNAEDFVTATPTPGEQNFRARQLTPVVTELEPPSLDRPGRTVSVEVELRNDGTESLSAGRVRLECGFQWAEGLLDDLAPGATVRLGWQLRPEVPGRWPVTVVFPVPGSPDTLFVELGALQVGPAALMLNEVMSAPGDGQGEWVELLAADAALDSLAGYRLRDADGSWVTLPGMLVRADGFVVVAQDSSALAAWIALNDSGPTEAGCDAFSRGELRHLGGWPALNNTPPASRTYADRVLLADSTGVVIDHVTIGEEGSGLRAGRSLERIAPVPAANPGGNWAMSLAPAGSTPGCSNSVSRTDALSGSSSGLTAEPPVADRTAGTAAVHLRFTLPPHSGGCDLLLYDLDGVAVRDLGGDRLGPGARDLFWDLRDENGRDVSPGGYLAVLRVLDNAGTIEARDQVLVVVR